MPWPRRTRQSRNSEHMMAQHPARHLSSMDFLVEWTLTQVLLFHPRATSAMTLKIHTAQDRYQARLLQFLTGRATRSRFSPNRTMCSRLRVLPMLNSTDSLGWTRCQRLLHAPRFNMVNSPHRNTLTYTTAAAQMLPGTTPTTRMGRQCRPLRYTTQRATTFTPPVTRVPLPRKAITVSSLTRLLRIQPCPPIINRKSASKHLPVQPISKRNAHTTTTC